MSSATNSPEQPTLAQLEKPIRDYLARHGLSVGQLDIRFDGRFADGVASRGLERITVRARSATGKTAERALLIKHSNSIEPPALRALQPLLASVPELPELIADGEDEGGHWLVMPSYRGIHPEDRYQTPSQVFAALAHVHAHWEGRTHRLAGIPVIDMAWWRDLCLNYTTPILERCLRQKPSEAVSSALAAIKETLDDPRIAAALDLLPRTLLHGDMHDANILIGEDGVKIIDWGTARLGPAMLDVANIAAHGSTNEQHYLDVRERLDGVRPPATLVELDYRWAEVQINTQYLHYVAEHRPEQELRAMLETRERALGELGRCLDVYGG